jgi:hypothetical protein
MHGLGNTGWDFDLKQSVVPMPIIGHEIERLRRDLVKLGAAFRDAVSYWFMLYLQPDLVSVRNLTWWTVVRLVAST